MKVETKKMVVDEKHYDGLENLNNLWKLIHRLEGELIDRGVTLEKLDKIRAETFPEPSYQDYVSGVSVRVREG